LVARTCILSIMTRNKQLKLSDYDAIIFDMDGVLTDSEPLWKIAMEKAFASSGSRLTKKDFQQTVGLRIDEVVAHWAKHENWTISPTEIEQVIMHNMCELIRDHAIALPGVIKTLEYLKSRQIKIGLATSSYEQLIEAVLKKLGIKHHFNFTHSAEHEEFGKPHPAVYLTTAKQLKVNPTRCLVIEDSFNGIISAKAARMHVVCIPEKTHEPDPRLKIADFEYETMEVMLSCLS
jgi:HAD superfamily hydrolase (TIGR01509 family)